MVNIDFSAGPASRSRYCEFRLCPHPASDPDGALQALVDQASRLPDRPVLYPASDQFFAFVTDHRQQLEPYYRMALPPAEACPAMLDKRKQYELALASGIDCAKTIYPETGEDVARLSQSLDYPAFIKPHEGHVWRRFFQNKGFMVRSPEELEERCREIFPTQVKFMVQSFILGGTSNSYSASFYIAADGECLGSFTSRKLRQFDVDAGVGTLVESYVRPDMVELGLRVCRMLRYHGIAEIEFKQDDRDGKLKLIELNPRLWIQSQLAASAGVDFAVIQFLDLLGHRAPAVNTFRPGVVWLDWVADYQACRYLQRHGKLSFSQWLSSWTGARSFATFAMDDLGPFASVSKEPVQGFASAGMRRLFGKT